MSKRRPMSDKQDMERKRNIPSLMNLHDYPVDSRVALIISIEHSLAGISIPYATPT